MRVIKRGIALIISCCFLFACLPISGLAASVGNKNTACDGGTNHSIAVKADGTVWTWGQNEAGQLGLGESVDAKDKPASVTALKSVVEVAAGYEFSAALSSDGSVYIWGQFGDAATLWEPVRARELSDIISIAAGQNRLLALDKQGRVYEYTYGEASVQIQIPSTVVQISAGGDFYLALDNVGSVYAWGSNSKGQLGNGTTNQAIDPQKIAKLHNIVDVAAGFTHALAVDEGGAIWAWGSNEYGELGIQLKQSKVATPTKLGTEAKFKNVEAGYNGSMAISTKGELYTWGHGEYGQIGDGTIKSQVAPTRISTNYQVTQIASGVYHNLLISASNNLYVWGRNRDGQIGNGTKENVTAPIQTSHELLDKLRYNLMTATASTWAIAELDELYRRELIPMYAWKNLSSNMTRGEFAAILIDAYESVRKSRVEVTKKILFTDTVNNPFELQIAKAVNLGLATGKSEISFDPQGLLTRQEAAKMICLFSSLARNTKTSFTDTDVSIFKDAYEIAPWAEPYVCYANQNKLMSGTTDKQFKPLDQLTKQEGLLLLARMARQSAW